MKRIESYEDVRRRRGHLARALKYLALLFVAFELVSSYAFKSFIIESASMAPTLRPKDRVIVLPSAYGLPNPFGSGRALFGEPQRGDVVLIRPPYAKRLPWYSRLCDAALRFLTFQRVRVKGMDGVYDAPLVKRVVGLPGDSIEIRDSLVYVRAKGSEHYLTEYEVSGRSYDIAKAELPDGWGKAMPLSGTFGPIVLEAGQYFVLGDKRSAGSDSRFFGPIASSSMLGKVVLRFWPLDRPLGL